MYFFRIAESHKLPHSTMEKIFNDFTLTFMGMFRLLAAKMQFHVGPGENIQLAAEFFEGVFQGMSSTYQREQFAKQHFCYVKPEEHASHDGTNFQ